MLLHTKNLPIQGSILDPGLRRPRVKHNAFALWTSLPAHHKKFLSTSLESKIRPVIGEFVNKNHLSLKRIGVFLIIC
jgi:hypothetical protein